MDLKAFPCVASGTINSRNGEIATVAVGGYKDTSSLQRSLGIAFYHGGHDAAKVKAKDIEDKTPDVITEIRLHGVQP